MGPGDGSANAKSKSKVSLSLSLFLFCQGCGEGLWLLPLSFFYRQGCGGRLWPSIARLCDTECCGCEELRQQVKQGIFVRTSQVRYKVRYPKLEESLTRVPSSKRLLFLKPLQETGVCETDSESEQTKWSGTHFFVAAGPATS